MTEKYTIDNAKNDIQNLQSQNLFDFQEIKRLNELINDYEKRVSQAINLNNQINKKIENNYENLKKTALDRIKYLEDELSSASGGSGLTITQIDKLNEAYTHSQSYHTSKQEIQSLNNNVNTINNNLNTHINSKHLSQTDVENTVNELMKDLGGLDSSQVAKLETAYNHSQTAHLTINDVNNLLGNLGGSTVNTNINVVTPGFIGNETFYEFDDIGNDYMTNSDNKTLEITSIDFLQQFYDIYVGEHDGLTVTKNIIGYDNTNTYPVYEYDFIPKNYSRTILLTSGMHTYELSATYGLAHFIKDYMTKPNAHKGFSYIRQNVRMKVIPIVNPWGFNQSPKTYGNVNGVNPNRNFDFNGAWKEFTGGNEWNKKGDEPFSEQETKNIVNWLYYNKDIAEFWIDCHTAHDDKNNDIWVVYVTPTPLEPKINSVINKLKNRFKSYYGVTNPVVNIQINLDSSIKHKFSTYVMGIPVISLEQSPLRNSFKTGEYNNNGGAIREYACQLYAFIQEFLNCESKSIGLLDYISELNHKIMDNSCKQIAYYPSEPYMKFVNAPHLNYEFVGNGQLSTSTLKVNNGTLNSEDGSYTQNNNRFFTEYIQVSSLTLKVTSNYTSLQFIVRCFDSNYNYLGVGNPSNYSSSGDITLQNKTSYVVLVFKNSDDTVLNESNCNKKIVINNVEYTLIYDNTLSLQGSSQPSTPTVKTYSVTYNLNGVSSSNNTTTITENSNYNTTLSADNNLTINSVSVTVGGVNVTDSVYSNGIINIDNVNGNIVINASAINEGGNEGDDEDSDSIIKCKNISIKSTDGTESASTTRISTDFIPLTISGNLSITSLTTENYQFLLRFYDGDKKYLGSAGTAWTLDGSKVYIYSNKVSVKFDDVRYLRIVYKSKNGDDIAINTISGRLALESDENFKSLIMSDY